MTEGDLFIDFANSVGTKDFIQWCAEHNVMYINTGETDWEDNWYDIFEENIKKNELRKQLKQRKKQKEIKLIVNNTNKKLNIWI